MARPTCASACATPRAARGGRAAPSSRARPFTSIDDLALRVPELRKDEINRLAEIGALNSLERIHRRDALWQAQRAVLPVGPLLEPLEEKGEPSPLARMNVRRAPVGRLPRHGPDHRPASHGLPPRGNERAGRDARHRPGAAFPTAAWCASPDR